MFYIVRKNETPQQIANRFGKSGDWQRLIMVNSGLGLRPLGKDRRTGSVLYTFARPDQGGKYREKVRLNIPASWLNARTRAMAGVVGASSGSGDDEGGGFGYTVPGGDGGGGGGSPSDDSFQTQFGSGYCLTDDACPEGQTCSGFPDFQCVGKATGFDYAPSCPDGYYWDAQQGKCIKSTMPGAGCKSNADCGGGAGQCVNGICQIKAEQGGCAANGAACGPNQVCCAGSSCQGGKCVPNSGPAPSTCTAADGSCTSDANCCSGLTCQSGKCAPQPAPSGGSSLTWLWGTLGVLSGIAVVGAAIYVGTKDDKGKEKKAPAAQ